MDGISINCNNVSHICKCPICGYEENVWYDDEDYGYNPCYYCDVNKEVIETDEDCDRYLPDEDI